MLRSSTCWKHRLSAMKQPEIRQGPGPERQKERLARWLAEWRVEQTLSAAAQAGEATLGKGGDAPIPLLGPLARTTSGEAEPAVGQIRLFSPEIPTAGLRPVYIAVLRNSGQDGFVTAPFSRFAEPALLGEIETGHSKTPFRVLCLWNARPVAAVVLSLSWRVAELSAEEVADALCLYDHLTSGHPLPAALAAKLGPPLVHPDDPRQIYRNREAVRMDRLLEEGPRCKGTAGPHLYPRPGSTDLPMAAEPREEYGAEPGGPSDQDQ